VGFGEGIGALRNCLKLRNFTIPDCQILTHEFLPTRSENFLLTVKEQKVVMPNWVRHLVLSGTSDPEIEGPDPETSSG
jgi:hypothetical protein